MRQYELYSKEHHFYLCAAGMFGVGEDQDEFDPNVEVETEDSADNSEATPEVATENPADDPETAAEVTKVPVDDPQAVRVYKYWANELVSKFTAVCDRPFYVEIAEYPRKGDDAYNVAVVATCDGEGFVIDPDESMERIELLGKIQDFVKYDFDFPDEDYLGSISISVYMQYLERDGEKIEDPTIDVLADLAFASFYEAVDLEFCADNVRVQYINAPDLAEWDEDECPEDEEDEEGEEPEEEPKGEEGSSEEETAVHPEDEDRAGEENSGG